MSRRHFGTSQLKPPVNHRGILCFGIAILAVNVSTDDRPGNDKRANCPAFQTMCLCAATYENGCFVCKCNGGSSGSGSNPFANFHPGEYPGMSSNSSTSGSSQRNGTSSGSSGPASSAATSGQSGTLAGSSNGTSGQSGSASGSGNLACAPLPRNCPPFMVKQDSQGCPTCSTSGSGGLTAGQHNNCPPIDFTCPTLHIDRNGCPMCGSGSVPTTKATISAAITAGITLLSLLTTKTSNPTIASNVTSLNTGNVISTRSMSAIGQTLGIYPNSTHTAMASNHTKVLTTTSSFTVSPQVSTMKSMITIPPREITCAVCAGPPEACELAYYEDTCRPPNHYCINHVTTKTSGQRLVERRCGNIHDCYNDWYLGSSDDDKCRQLSSTNILTYNFECSYCCIKDGCNVDLHPKRDTLYMNV